MAVSFTRLKQNFKGLGFSQVFFFLACNYQNLIFISIDLVFSFRWRKKYLYV